jgi:hypothetical protein
VTVDDAHCHTASAVVAVPAERAFAYLSDGLRQGDWTLGSWNRRRLPDGTFAGTSLFDGRETFVRIDPEPELGLVRYSVGRSRDALRPLVWARVVPGPSAGLGESECIVTLMTWRPADGDDAVFERTRHAFFAEIQMIKGRLELGF